jgi:hypothetical protein
MDSTMWNELFARQNKGVADAKALRDANDSLAHMLNSFYKKRYTEWTDAQRNAIVGELDMAPVSAQWVRLADVLRVGFGPMMNITCSHSRYEKEIQEPIKNVVLGDLVEMILIQIQFIKKETLAAMDAMDDILKQNQVRLAPFHTAFLCVCNRFVRGALCSSIFKPWPCCRLWDLGTCS